jgi:transporter family protein
MSWAVLSIVSALLLGVYDLLKKSAVRNNAVLPVLFFSVVAAAAAWAPFLAWSHLSPASIPSLFLLVEPITAAQHLQLAAKSVIVAGAWIFGYFAVKHLPVSITGPIRSTSPLWTVIIAASFLGEHPSARQWLGVAVVMFAFYAFSFVGKLEGICFRTNKWVGFMIIAAALSSCSALYDKFLLQKTGMTPPTIQCWFSIYLVVAIVPFYAARGRVFPARSPFQWRWSIPCIGLTLLVADLFYYYALQQDGALISVISPLRRSAVVVTFLGGICLYGEKNWKPKLACIAALLLGAILLTLPGND